MRAQSRLVRAARISAAKAVFDACPDSAFRDDFAACIFAGTTDPDAGVRSVAVGPTRVLFRRFLPAKHSAIFATLLSQLPPVVVSDDEVEASIGDGGSEKVVTEPEVVSASEQAFARLSKGKSENVQRWVGLLGVIAVGVCVRGLKNGCVALRCARRELPKSCLTNSLLFVCFILLETNCSSTCNMKRDPPIIRTTNLT